MASFGLDNSFVCFLFIEFQILSSCSHRLALHETCANVSCKLTNLFNRIQMWILTWSVHQFQCSRFILFFLNSLCTALKYAWGYCLVGIWTHDQSDSVQKGFHDALRCCGIRSRLPFPQLELHTIMECPPSFTVGEFKLWLVCLSLQSSIMTCSISYLLMVILETFSDSDLEAFISAWRPEVVFLLSLVLQILR